MDAPVQLVFGPLDLTVSSPFSGVQPSLDGPFDRRAKRCPCSNSHATKSSVRWLCPYFSHCQDQLHNLWSLCSKVIKNFECNDGALNQAHSFLPRAWSLGPHHPNQSSDSFSAQSSLSLMSSYKNPFFLCTTPHPFDSTTLVPQKGGIGIFLEGNLKTHQNYKVQCF